MIEVDRHIHQGGGGISAALVASSFLSEATSVKHGKKRTPFLRVKTTFLTKMNVTIEMYMKFCTKYRLGL